MSKAKKFDDTDFSPPRRHQTPRGVNSTQAIDLYPVGDDECMQIIRGLDFYDWRSVKVTGTHVQHPYQLRGEVNGINYTIHLPNKRGTVYHQLRELRRKKNEEENLMGQEGIRVARDGQATGRVHVEDRGRSYTSGVAANGGVSTTPTTVLAPLIGPSPENSLRLQAVLENLFSHYGPHQTALLLEELPEALWEEGYGHLATAWGEGHLAASGSANPYPQQLPGSCDYVLHRSSWNGVEETCDAPTAPGLGRCGRHRTLDNPEADLRW